MKSGGFHMKSGRFHEILRHSLPPALPETEEFLLSYLIYKVSRWNLPDFTWNPPEFMKSARFHMKSTRIHEICQISHEIHMISADFMWNPADFTKDQLPGMVRPMFRNII